jgi:hypothetical protein
MNPRTHDLNELKTLIDTADRLVERLKGMTPPDAAWADWRLRGAANTLDALRKDMDRLTTEVQLAMWKQSEPTIEIVRALDGTLTRYDLHGHDPRVLPYDVEAIKGQPHRVIYPTAPVAKELIEKVKAQGRAPFDFQLPSLLGPVTQYTGVAYKTRASKEIVYRVSCTAIKGAMGLLTALALAS